MARYRSKDETDLTWNRTRRQLTRDLDTRIANFREELLNRMLTSAWEKFSEMHGLELRVELKPDTKPPNMSLVYGRKP